MDTQDTFGAWLRRRRRALDLTQEALADCAGCSLATIRKFEADERRPSRQLAGLLARCLRVPAEEEEQFVTFARMGEVGSRGAGGRRSGGESSAAIARQLTAVIAPPVPHAPAPLLPRSPAPPPPHSPTPPLPTPLTPLLGRETDIAAVADLLGQPGVRVVTLTGPGGTGKTRLAIAAGRHLAEATPPPADLIAFIDLSPIDDPARVVPAVAAALGVKDVAGRTPLDGLIAHLGHRPALLILDNFEQVVDAAGDLLRLLTAAGGLKLLITSRAVLRLYGEFEYPVSPLALPPPGAAGPEELLAAPAVALFVERARAARPGFALSPDNAAAVAQLCARLDGLPLAIELAAARVKLLSPGALLGQLSRSLDLAGQVRHAGERQRTLRGAIDWSYRLLEPEEQLLFDRLGVFNGDFSLTAAAAAGGDGPAGDALDPDAVPFDFVDRLTSLIDKSMIKPAGEEEGGEPRFRLLAVLREYALERLSQRGETEAIAGRHLAYYLALARRIAPFLEQKEQAAWLRRLAAELDNLRAALDFGLARADTAADALRLVVALRGLWRFRGLFSEGRDWLARAIAAAPPDAPETLLAEAYSAAGMLARYQDDHEPALALLHRSLALYEALGPAADRRGMAVTLRNIAAIYYWREELERVERYSHEILAIERELNNLTAVATMLGNLASVYKLLGRFDLTRQYELEALALHRQVSGATEIASALNGLGLLEFHEGHLAEAQRHYDEGLALMRAAGNPYQQAMLLANLAESQMVQGRLSEALAGLEESLALARQGGFSRLEMTALFDLALLRLLEGGRPAEVWPDMRRALTFWVESGIRVMVDVTLYPVALLLSRAGRHAAALRLVSYVDARTRNPVRAPDFVMMLDEIAPAARAGLGEAGYAATEAEGRALSPEGATALALREGDALPAPASN